MRVDCDSSCTQPQYEHLLTSDAWASVQVWVSFPLWGCFCERKLPRFCSLCAPFLDSCLFPLHFPLTSSVTNSVGHCSASPLLLLPPPPILSNCSTQNPIFQHIAYHPPLSPFILSCQRQVYLSPGHPSSQQCVGQKLHSSSTRAVDCVHSKTVNVNGLCISFFYSDNTADTSNYSLVGRSHKRHDTQRRCIDSVSLRKPFLI